MTFRTLLAITFITLAGCATTVQKQVTSESDKIFEHPRVGQKVYAVSGGLVHLRTAYKSGYKYKVKEHLEVPVQLGLAKVTFRTGDDLRTTLRDGVEYQCASNNAYVDYIGYTSDRACLLVEEGKFTQLTYAPGILWFNVKLDKPAAFVRTEVATSMTGSYSKKELIYDGSQLGSLLFIEKVYGLNLTEAMGIRPLLVKIDSLPATVDAGGVKINVLEYKYNSITYSIAGELN